MPQIKYLLSQTRGNTRKNWDTILERLTVQKELSAINNDLRRIVRYPGKEHNNLLLSLNLWLCSLGIVYARLLDIDNIACHKLLI